jgi:hypothetical protein
LFGNDVVDLEARRGIGLWQLAILASVPGTPAHESGKLGIDGHYEARVGFFLSTCRARE